MGSQFPPQRGDDAIIISPQIPDKQLEFKEPISKKPRNVEDLSSNPSYPKRPNSLFYKTRLCLKFEFRGSCMNGNSCNFAHGSEDLRRPPPNWQELVGKDSNPSEEQVFVKNRICKKFYRGEVCSYGDRCIFMHVEPRLLNETSSAIERGDDNGNLGQHKSESIVVVGSGIACNQKGNYWKTKICNKWEATGHCAFGDKCHFAHGPAELMEFRNHFEFDRVKHAAVVAATPHHSQSIQDVNSRRTTTTALSMSSNANMPQTRTRSRTRGLLNWERLQNIYHIYADCIDGLPPYISGPEQ